MTIQTGLSGEKGYTARWIDGYALSEDKAVIGDFLGSLLTHGQATMLIEPVTGDSSSSLASLFFAYRQGEKLRAEASLYWGYPCVVVKRDEDRICLPLFYWPCRMEPAKESATAWELTVVQEGAVANGYFDIEHLPADSPVKTLLDTACTAGLARALPALCLKLAALPGWRLTSDKPILLPLPDSSEAGAMFNDACSLHWSAMLSSGTLPMYSGQCVDIDWKMPAPAGSEKAHRYSFVQLDPNQAEVFRQLAVQKYVMASGVGGSGKTQVVKHLLINALSNNRKVLVLAPDVASLEQIRSSLSAWGLEQLAFTLRDPKLDRHLLTALLSGRDRRLPKAGDYDEQLFIRTVRSLQRIQDRLDACFDAVRKRIFGNHSWSDVVGLYLTAAGRQPKDQLAINLPPGVLRFSSEEMDELSRDIAVAAGLYTALMRAQPLHPSQHPLNTLSAKVFTEQQEGESFTFIREHVTHFRQKSLELHEKIVRYSGIYLEELQVYHERHYRGLQAAFHRLEELLEDSTEAVGEELLRTSRPTLRLAGLFSGKCKLALDRQFAIRDQLGILIELHQQHVGFPFEWPLVQGLERKPAVLAALLIRFAAALDGWRSALPTVIQDDALRLNSQTALQELPATRQIAVLEQELAELVASLNEAGVFGVPVEAKMMTMPRRQKFLEELTDKLDVILKNLDHYAVFYYWQRHWFGLSDTCRKLVSALSRTATANWVHLFESWYFNQCLQLTYDPVPPPASDLLEQYAQQWEQLGQLLLPQICKEHEQQQEKALKKIRQSSRELSDPLLTAQELWIRLFDRYSGLLLQLYPVWLTTPRQAAQLMSASDKPLFDYLVIEDAHQLSRDECLPCMSTARQSLLLANPLQEAWNPRSVVKDAVEGGVSQTYLRFFHQLRPADVASFTVTPPARQAGTALQFTYVGGLYQEFTGVNEAEIDYILGLLSQIEEKPQHTYPCIGIVTMTVSQRNALLGRLLQVKRERSEGVELLQQLERNGLGVYALHEIGGQQFDMLLVSGVFSAIGWPQRLAADMAGLMNEHFLAGLAGLMAASCRSLHVISSFTLSQLDTYLRTWDAEGMRMYAAYLRYAGSGGEEVIARIGPVINDYYDGVVSWPLLHEISRRSAADLKETNIQVSDYWPGCGLPMVVTAAHGGKTAINADGFWSEGSSTDYYWEWQQRQHYLAAGFQLFETSAQEWWKNPVSQLSGFKAGIEELPVKNGGGEKES